MSDPAISEAVWQRLTDAARAAQSNAYAPYSQFHVGAALLCEDGTVISGCNVENASYGLTICAERNAIAAAVTQGRGRFRAGVVVSPNGVSPCGACRQVLLEFAPEIPIRMIGEDGHCAEATVASLLPGSFGKEDLA